MFGRVPYTDVGGRHRPYLEVAFLDETGATCSSKTFAMIDSGADHTLVPYSLGNSIGLAAPTAAEVLASVGGVGGQQSYIERNCQIAVANRTSGEIYVFNETVWWIYPDEQTRAEQERLQNAYKQFTTLQEQSIPDTDLYAYFENEKTQVIQELNAISNRLETDVLLGRPFFDNFEFIQFFHKDRNREERCFFNYKVAVGKPVEILPIASTGLVGATRIATGVRA